MFAGNFAPAGWMFCAGQLLAISENDTLFNLIGTTYGGDGQSTFALPDLRGRIPLHFGTGFTLAETGGVETITLTVQQIQAFNGTTSLGSFPVTSDATGDPIYIGVLDNAGPNVTSVIFSLTSCGATRLARASVSSAPDASRSHAATSQPLAASCITSSRPIPLAAPETTASRPAPGDRCRRLTRAARPARAGRRPGCGG